MKISSVAEVVVILLQADIKISTSFQTGNMLNLDAVTDASFDGIAAFYSIVNIPPSSISSVLQELRRVLKPDGVLLLTFHIGQEQIHIEEMLGREVALDFFFYQTAEIKNQLESVGFELEEVIERDPYAEAVEHQSRRAYIFARKPNTAN